MTFAPPWPSSPGWNMKITDPCSSLWRTDSSFAAPTRPAVCRSWPQACMLPLVEARGLIDGEGVHVAAQEHNGTGVRTAQHRDDGGRAGAGRDLQRQSLERGEDLLLRARQLEPQLGVGVQRAPQDHDLGIPSPPVTSGHG